jgi:putative flippase GtrA
MNSTRLSEELRKILVYGLVGLFNTGLTAGIMWLSHRAAVPYPVYTTYAYLIGMLASFALNWAFTFRQGGRSGRASTLLRFAAVNLALLGLVHVEQYLLIERLQVRESLGVALGMVCYTGLGYFINRLWVFKNPLQSPKEQPHATD